jgi:hypothetical protein
MAREVTDQEIAEARARGARMRAAGLAATSVRFDAEKRRLVMELSNGNLFGVPVSALPSIAGATDADLASVELLGETIVHIESLDADYSVAGLIQNAFGPTLAARALGSSGGRSVSAEKAAAARANGAKGGRPRRDQAKLLRVSERSSVPGGRNAYGRNATSPKGSAKKKTAKKR